MVATFSCSRDGLHETWISSYGLANRLKLSQAALSLSKPEETRMKSRITSQNRMKMD